VTHVSKPIPGRKTADRGLSPSRQTHLGLMLCMSPLFAATLSTSPANRRFGYTDRRAGADQNHLPSSIRAIRTTSHAAGASSATCTSPSQERQLTCSCVAAGISTLRAGVPRLRGIQVWRARSARLQAPARKAAVSARGARLVLLVHGSSPADGRSYALRTSPALLLFSDRRSLTSLADSRARSERSGVAASTDGGLSSCRLARSTRSSHQSTTLSSLARGGHDVLGRCGSYRPTRSPAFAGIMGARRSWTAWMISRVSMPWR
jgi:hypothetical protein